VGDLVFLKLGPRRGFRRAPSAIDLYERALALEATDPAGAMAGYRRALVARPGLADAYNNLGRLHHDKADAGAPELGDAEALYRLAICADPNVALYWFNLGVAVEDQGRGAEAIAAYEQALALDPLFADAHFNLARQLELAGARRGGTDELVLRRAIRHLKRYRDLVRAG
jgi:tetratricopeptide (TPR) repeat protein